MPIRAAATLAATAIAVILMVSFRTPPAAPVTALPAASATTSPNPSPTATPTATPSGAPPAGGGRPTPRSTPTPAPTASPAAAGSAGTKSGTFTGRTVNVYYGNVQIALLYAGGKIVNVRALQYPNDNPQSSYINSQALPLLRQEVLKIQSARINGVSGATYTSYGFYESLTSALKLAGA